MFFVDFMCFMDSRGSNTGYSNKIDQNRCFLLMFMCFMDSRGPSSGYSNKIGQSRCFLLISMYFMDSRGSNIGYSNKINQNRCFLLILCASWIPEVQVLDIQIKSIIIDVFCLFFKLHGFQRLEVQVT